LHCVEGFNRRKVLPEAFLIDVLNIFFLNVGTVAQQSDSEVMSGRRAINGAAKSPVYQVGYIAAVVNVGMGEEKKVKGFRIEREIKVEVLTGFAPSLEEAAIKEYPSFLETQNVA